MWSAFELKGTFLRGVQRTYGHEHDSHHPRGLVSRAVLDEAARAHKERGLATTASRLGSQRLACVVFAVVATACAPRAASTPFVKKGSGFVDIGGPPPGPAAPSREAVDRAIREAQAQRAARASSAAPVVEGRDDRLRTAIAALEARESESAHLSVAAEYARVGVLDMAYDHFTAALRLNPRSAAALDGRARLMRDVGLLTPALTDAHRARYFDPSSAAARNTLGTILERRGLCREALAAYREAARLKPDASWARDNVERLGAECP